MIFLQKWWLGIVLWILNTVSVFFILQIIFGLIPLFETSYSIDEINKINSLVIDCSIGILASTLFYILLVFIPERRKARSARRLQKRNLQFLCENMQFIILYLVKVYSLKVKDSDYQYSKIALKEFDKVTRFFLIDSPKSFPLYVRTGNMSSLVTDKKDFDVKKIYRSIDKLINSILSNPTIIFEDDDLIDLLNSISTCRLFDLLQMCEAGEYIAKDTLNLALSNLLNLAITDFYTFYLCLLRYSSPSSFFIKEETV